ncbi:MAG: mandelate racemase/muconate lactonizing enzyme family protein [Solirubrobacteraceae bacterium]|nr:mandelate racemase/muconate lactonizing enzyme family protein [Solirubrobacteraceae bacterium]
MTALDPIDRIDALELTVPLADPLRLGPLTITERRYAVVRVHTREGLTGIAYALTRDAPVTQAVAMLAPLLRGRDADLIAARHHDCVRATAAAGRVGVVMRAIALVDIALWDIKAQRAGLPLWRLLGGAQRETQLMLVAGYPRDDLAPEALAERVAAYAHDGHGLLKIARAHDQSRMRTILDRLTSSSLPPTARLVIDCAWCYESVGDAEHEIAAWPDVPLEWLEDPMPPEDVRAIVRLRERLGVPLGVGDELSDPNTHRELVRCGAVDVLRVDVANLGVTGALHVCALAAAERVPVSFHVYPEIAVHLAAAMTQRAIVESFDPLDNPFDPTHSFVRGGPVIEPGVALAPELPGLGFSIDEERLTALGYGAVSDP